MSDTNTAPTYTKDNPPVVSRNETTKALSLTEFGKKSDNKGKPFWTPTFTPETFENDIKWADMQEVCNTLNREYRLIFGDIAVDEGNVLPDGTPNYVVLMEQWADFTAGVQKLSDIKDEIESLQDKQSTLVQSPDFQLSEEGTPVSAEAAAIVKEMRENNVKIKGLKLQSEAISAKYKVRAEARVANKAKKEAAAKAAAGTSATQAVEA